jgi:AAA15 family ATPase/GTPase
MSDMSKTFLKRIKITNFRALKNVDIEFGTDITLICGKNGTAKSSILGIAAQIFSFDKNYETGNNLSYKTITGVDFKSKFQEHFRVSKKFDATGSMDVNVELYDAYSNSKATGDLTLTIRSKNNVMKAPPALIQPATQDPRMVVRNNSTAKEGQNKDRNFTYPVIFLSLKRLYPIVDRTGYAEAKFDYLNDINHRNKFISLVNELLNKTSSMATGTTGTIKSAVTHGDNYDHNSVSVGEDNAGQIVLALMSFRKLKEEYKDYKGGLLLIDEADAGLFPAAQTKLIDILNRECRKLGLQVIMTSHSTTMIEKVYEKSKKDKQSRFKTIYLTDSYGGIQARLDMNWSEIYADINIQTIPIEKETHLPKINVYFEDAEGIDLFNALTYRNPIKKLLNVIGEVSLGCNNYIQLIEKKVLEFSRKSIICLDADVAQKADAFPSIVLLPGHLPPDQLIFEYLYNLPPEDKIWENKVKFTHPVLQNCASDIIRILSIGEPPISLKKILSDYHDNGETGKTKPRDLFKDFYKHEDFQIFLKQVNLWKKWIETNPEAKADFLDNFISRLKHIYKSEYGIGESKLAFLKTGK